MYIMKRTKRDGNRVCFVLRLLVILCLGLLIGAGTAKAEDTVEVKVYGTYMQTDARNMLTYVNNFRNGTYTDGGQTVPWALANDGTIDTASYSNLSALTYDYKLEEYAMQRAIEIAYLFEHERPDGTDPLNAGNFPSEYYAKGENIYAGWGKISAESAFTDWTEVNDSYEYQGHRRNMLSSMFNRLGCAGVCVKKGNQQYSFWVQELGKKSTSGTELNETTANDSETLCTLNILPSDAGLSTELTPSSNSIKTDILTTVTPAVTKSFRASENNYPANTSLIGEYSCSWTIQNSDIADIDLETGKITPKKTGTTVITVTSDIGTNTSTASVNLTVEPVSLKQEDVSISPDFYTYSGSSCRPNVTVVHNGSTLSSGTDYTISYSDNIDAGEATVTVIGTGSYKGTIAKKFTIAKKDLSEFTVTGVPDSVTYDGNEKKPVITVKDGTKDLNEGVDYTVQYGTNTDVGQGTVTVTAAENGNYSGSINRQFTISARSLASDTVITFNNDSVVYNRSSQTSNIKSVTNNGRLLKVGQDYEVSYSGDIENVGTVEVIITGKGNYTDEATNSFDITAKDISGSEIVLNQDRFVYNGSEQKPVITAVTSDGITLEASDYTGPEYSNNINAGSNTALLKITGKGNFKGTAEKTFTISPLDISKAVISLSQTEYTYSGSENKPEVTSVTLNGTELSASDYLVEYPKDMVQAGTPKITVKGKGNYGGFAEISFTIAKKDLSEFTVTGIPASVTYNGSNQTPNITVKDGDTTLRENTDYSVSYSNNINAGKAFVTITGKGNYTGSQSAELQILQKPISDAVIADIADQKYTGFEVTPLPVVKDGDKILVKDQDYRVSYRNNTEAGSDAAVVIEGLCNYSGTTEKSFTIIKASEPDKQDNSGNNNGSQPNGGKDNSGQPNGGQNNGGLPSNDPVNAPDSEEKTEQRILGQKTDQDPAGSTFFLLRVKATKVTKKSVKVQWTKVPGTDHYVIYSNRCGTKYQVLKKVASAKSSFTQKKLKKGTYYKYLIAAVDSQGKVIALSKSVHVATSGGKVGNDKAVQVNRKKVTLKTGRKFKLKVKEIPQNRKLKVRRHRKPAFESDHPEIAMVTKKGVIRAKKRGKAVIYVYAQNGVYAKVKVTVR